MKKLSIVSLLAVLLTSYSCADQDTPDKPQGKWGPIEQQGTCNEECPKQECPRLECNGEECPSCPTCEVCPICQNGGECDTSTLNNEISRLQRDLNTQRDATEECLGDLDTCTNDLSSKTKSLQKNGTRIKIRAYHGSDGLVYPNSLYDTKYDTTCLITSTFCSDKSYCIPYENGVFLSESMRKYPYCNYPDSLNYLEYFAKVKSQYVYASDEISSLFLDESCSIPLNKAYIRDDDCTASQNMFWKKTKFVTTTDNTSKMCLDNSVLTTQTTKQESITTYYKISKPEYTKLYSKYSSSSPCKESSYEKVVLLDEMHEQDFINIAKQKRQEYISNFCDEFLKEDWVSIETKVIDD